MKRNLTNSKQILKKNIKVTAIITTHNRCTQLNKAIQSVLHQTYKNIECIVVDDASTDGTKEYCSRLDNIIYVRIESSESKGGNYARNLGIQKAQGEYVAFLDDDDKWLPEKITKQVELLNTNYNTGLVYCGRILHIITGNSETNILRYPDKRNKKNIKRRILYTIPCVTSTIMVRRKLLFDIGLFDESLPFWQEYELMIRLCQITEIDFINECLIIYQENLIDKNRLTNKYEEWIMTVEQMAEKHKSLYDQLTFYERYMQRLLFYSDAKNRSLFVGNMTEYYKNKTKMFYYKIITFPYRCYTKWG